MPTSAGLVHSAYNLELFKWKHSVAYVMWKVVGILLQSVEPNFRCLDQFVASQVLLEGVNLFSDRCSCIIP